MSQDSSLLSTFDLNTQQGVMSVLASIRASDLPPATKNELRDLVFLYTNGGGDVSVKNSLEQKLATHQIAPVAVKKTGAPAPTLAFGTYRPTPTFKAPVQAPTVPGVAAVVTPPAPVAVPVAPTPVVAPVAAAPSIPLPSSPLPEVVPAPVIETPAPVIPSVVPSASSAPLPTPPAVAQTATPPVSSGSEAQYLERIRQIKTAVNSKVGNPVNLVDIDNQVGREYMNTLLEAMKKLSSGAVSEMGVAMQKLEVAYAAVEVAIAKHQATSTPNAVPSPVSESVTATPVPPVPLIPPAAEAPAQVSGYDAVVPETPVPAAEAPLPLRPELTPQSDSPSAFASTDDIVSGVIPQPSVVPLVDIVVPTPSVPQYPTSEAAETESGFGRPQPIASLAEEKKILTPLDLPDPTSLATSEFGDPLFTKEIDAGLNQLLSDWTLFKKSGLFGTGPKGSEHPLFKKIAELPVPLLLAGRFEGSTQEIRQSITDYMNGWRYEQGIIYQPGETFERYLRRVIKHILDLQKKSKQA